MYFFLVCTLTENGGYTELDPLEDTERNFVEGWKNMVIIVTPNSIRLRILKEVRKYILLLLVRMLHRTRSA